MTTNRQHEGSEGTPSEEQSSRKRLLDVAERWFASHSYEAASLREITAQAGVSLGMVRHYFGSKQGLLAAVFQQVFETEFEDRRQTLAALLSANPEPSVEDLFVALFEPLLRSFNQPLGGQRLAFRLRGIFEHEAYWPVVSADGAKIADGFFAAFARALESVPLEEVIARYDAAVLVVFMGVLPTSQNIDTPQLVKREQVERLLHYAFLIIADRQPKHPLRFEILKSWGAS